jgi:hypothetical protein
VRAALLLTGGLLLGYAYFYQAGGWNQNSRLDLTRALVERGTVRIDAYARNTGDRAKCGPEKKHLCTDKAPGASLTAVPAVAAARPFTRNLPFLSWLATFFVAGLPTAAAALLVHRLARRLGAGEGGALFAAAAWGLATPAWAYATLFFGHALAAACLLAAFAAADALAQGRTIRRDRLLALAVGAAGGWATVTEFPAAVPAAIVCALAVVNVRPRGHRAAARVVVCAGIGALVCAAALAAYNVVAFGKAFGVGYQSVEGFAGMKQGFLGVTYPKAGVLGEILFGRFRGLLPLAPIVAFAPLGALLVLAPRALGRAAPPPVADAPERGVRAATIAALAIALYYVLFNAAYVYWNGGWSYGPRHLGPGLPFFCLFLGVLWTRAHVMLRALLGAAAAWGAVMSLVAVSTTAQPPEPVKRPVGQLLWPAFADGDLSLNHQGFDEPGADWRKLRGRTIPHDAWNLGEKLGLGGHASLAPLLLAWSGLVATEVALRRRRRSS